MSDTPQTDAWCEVAMHADVCAVLDFARELERDLIQSQKNTINLRAFIQDLESVQQGLINQVQELNEANAGLLAELAKAQFGNTASPFCK